jgi:hypothetical protein
MFEHARLICSEQWALPFSKLKAKITKISELIITNEHVRQGAGEEQ